MTKVWASVPPLSADVTGMSSGVTFSAKWKESGRDGGWTPREAWHYSTCKSLAIPNQNPVNWQAPPAAGLGSQRGPWTWWWAWTPWWSVTWGPRMGMWRRGNGASQRPRALLSLSHHCCLPDGFYRAVKIQSEPFHQTAKNSTKRQIFIHRYK